MKVDNNRTFNATKGLEVTQSDRKEANNKVSETVIKRTSEENERFNIPEEKGNQIRELQKSNNNAQKGISLIQTAESALEEIYKKLQGTRTLVVGASNKEKIPADQKSIQNEIKKLNDDINMIAANTEFNSRKILTGDESVEFYVGSNNSARIAIPIGDMSTDSLGREVVSRKSLSDIDVTDFESISPNQQIGIIDKSIEDVSTEIENLAAAKDKLEDIIKNTQSEIGTTKEKYIENSAVAQEMLESYKKNVLYQASTTIGVQSNISQFAALQLLT